MIIKKNEEGGEVKWDEVKCRFVKVDRGIYRSSRLFTMVSRLIMHYTADAFRLFGLWMVGYSSKFFLEAFQVAALPTTLRG